MSREKGGNYGELFQNKAESEPQKVREALRIGPEAEIDDWSKLKVGAFTIGAIKLVLGNLALEELKSYQDIWTNIAPKMDGILAEAKVKSKVLLY